ncbi:50S ribosomal protein L7ae-like protein [Marininema halotolerans]|uniref:RNA-binding protein SAMN05444972_10961 n=1 Tax=Marininema halotolerans TaxID=1155944 RepID=A0A1I6T6X9_9BACL|nr:50S ribosomal protein L7ae-like protein [Marininema halotolerans]SFS84979.1 large subunit ribosomal protein L7A [Marininema halotolerans]
MSYDKVKEARTIVIGAKQTKKAIEQGKAEEVLIAQDADERVTKALTHLCRNRGIAVVYVDSMKDLGRACGIDVGAATAAVLK